MAAETLDVSSMLPVRFEPKRKNRWVLMIEGIDSYIVSKAARPSITLEPKEIPFINSRRYLSGKAEFGDMSVTLHDPIAPSGAQQVMEWVRTHWESVSGRAGYADFYKRDIQLKLLDPVGTVVELWDIKGAMITQAQFGDLAYEGSDFTEITLTLKFDNCVLQFLSSHFWRSTFNECQIIMTVGERRKFSCHHNLSFCSTLTSRYLTREVFTLIQILFISITCCILHMSIRIT